MHSGLTIGPTYTWHIKRCACIGGWRSSGRCFIDPILLASFPSMVLYLPFLVFVGLIISNMQLLIKSTYEQSKFQENNQAILCKLKNILCICKIRLSCFIKLQKYPFIRLFVSSYCCSLLNCAGIVGREQFPPSSQPQFIPNSVLRPTAPFVTQPPSASNYGLVQNPYNISQVIQPCTTIAGIPSSEQRPVFPVQSPQNFLNQPTLMHSPLTGAPTGGPGLPGVCPGVPQLNHMRPSSMSIHSVCMAMANFGNVQV